MYLTSTKCPFIWFQNYLDKEIITVAFDIDFILLSERRSRPNSVINFSGM